MPISINWPIGRKPGSIIERCCTDQGKPARTDITVVSKNTSKFNYSKNNSDDMINNSNICPADNSIIVYNHFTHVQCLLHTGRTHQIRVHLSQLWYPLAGDDLYGGHLEFIQRQALHASHVSFYHPITNEWLELHAEMPEDMNVLLND